MRSILALALLAVPAALVAEDKKPDADLKAMAGKWTIDKAELSGKDVTVEFKAATLDITADGKYAFVLAIKDSGTLALDPAKTPKEMDIKGTDGPNKGETLKAIYKIDGDAVTICYGLGGANRPTKFETKPDTKLFLATYKRSK